MIPNNTYAQTFWIAVAALVLSLVAVVLTVLPMSGREYEILPNHSAVDGIWAVNRRSGKVLFIPPLNSKTANLKELDN